MSEANKELVRRYTREVYSAGKSAFYRGAEAALSITGGLIVYRR